MADGVTRRLVARIERDFPGREHEVIDALGAAESGDQERERVLAAIILGAHGDLAEVHRGVELSRLDWRDVLVHGGLANADWPRRLRRQLGA